MRITIQNFGPVNNQALHALLAAENLPGFTGVSTCGDDLHLEFPDRQAVTAEEYGAALAVVQDYVYTPPAEG